jgi:serine/threonine protein kinase
LTFLKVIQWATDDKGEPNWEQNMALEFLDLCMELDPQKRISATAALEHPFLNCAEDDQLVDDVVFFRT